MRKAGRRLVSRPTEDPVRLGCASGTELVRLVDQTECRVAPSARACLYARRLLTRRPMDSLPRGRRSQPATGVYHALPGTLSCSEGGSMDCRYRWTGSGQSATLVAER